MEQCAYFLFVKEKDPAISSGKFDVKRTFNRYDPMLGDVLLAVPCLPADYLDGFRSNYAYNDVSIKSFYDELTKKSVDNMDLKPMELRLFSNMQTSNKQNYLIPALLKKNTIDDVCGSSLYHLKKVVTTKCPEGLIDNLKLNEGEKPENVIDRRLSAYNSLIYEQINQLTRNNAFKFDINPGSALNISDFLLT